MSDTQTNTTEDAFANYLSNLLETGIHLTKDDVAKVALSIVHTASNVKN